MSEQKNFCISMENPTEQQLAAFTQALDEMQEARIKEIEDLAVNLQVTYLCASDIVYLRTRARHTPELEYQLIELHKAGTPPNIFEFGVTEQTQQKMTELVEEVANRYKTN